MVTRVVVLLSGAGSLYASLQAAVERGELPIDIVAVLSDRADAIGVRRARDIGHPVEIIAPADYPDRAHWDDALITALQRHAPEWIVSAGFMRILGASVVDAFPNRIVNCHPALLPAFPGAHAVRDALAYGVKVTGSSIHLVDTGVDTGPVLAQRAVAVHDDDDEATLHERIKEVERELLVDTVRRLALHGCTVHDRRVSIP